MNKNYTNTLSGIELFRGVAAIMVAIYHISRHYEQNFGYFPFSRITEFGHSGVDFFFTLSGFIIYYIHKKDFNTKTMLYPYFVKRFARVYPFYWFIILISLFMVPFVSSATYPDILDCLKNIILWPQGMNNLIIGVSWTLQHEILFYLLFSLLILDKFLGTVTMLIWFFVLLISNYIYPLPFKIPVLLSPFNLQFFMGMFSAYILINFKSRCGLAYLAIGFIAFISTAFFEIVGYLNGFGKFARIFYGLSSMFLIIGIVTYEKNKGLTIPFLGKFFGRSSYSIYLTHLFFNGIYFKIFSLLGIISVLPHSVSALIIIVIAIISACFFSNFIELPLTKKVRTYFLKRTPI